jgi:hypothetical protein
MCYSTVAFDPQYPLPRMRTAASETPITYISVYEWEILPVYVSVHNVKWMLSGRVAKIIVLQNLFLKT